VVFILGNTIYDDLATNNGDLSYPQMLFLMTWVIDFRDQIVTKLGQQEFNLPQEPYQFGQTMLITLGSIGGVVAAAGIIVLILSKRGI
jgi:hypothetical protein